MGCRARGCRREPEPGRAATDGTDPLAQALDRISEQTGTLFVVAAGNTGYPASQIGTPGSATRALTVGNVSKLAPYEMDPSSSPGPRVGDLAIKPEITAPGMGIRAARSAASDLHPIATNPRYTALSGTSMATPHVTGAAALLAHQHPDWTAQQLKDSLVSAAQPNPATPTTQQGAGMLDVGRAVGTPLVATGVLNLGRITPPYPATVSASVVLRNTSAAAVHVDLGLTLAKAGSDLLSQTPYAPAPGAVTLSASTVDIAPGGTATVAINVAIGQLPLGTYFGRLESVVAGAVVARTTIGWTKDVPLHRLTVRGVDRAGAPAHTSIASWLSLMDLDTGETRLGWFVNGVAHFDGLGPDPLLREGRYALLANISDWTPAAPWFRLSETLGGDPELVLDRDHAITLDARQAERVQVQVPVPTETPTPHGMLLSWSREVGASATRQVFGLVHEIYVLPTGQASTGTFQTTVQGRLIAPDLTMSLTGTATPPLHPQYPAEPYQNRTSPPTACVWYHRCTPALASSGRYGLADGGTGTPAELASVGVRGKLVLIRETPADPPTLNLPQDIADPATAAGAAGLIIAVADSGPAVRNIYHRTGIPVVILTRAEGTALAASLAAGPVTVDTGGQPEPSFVYDVNTQLRGALPANGDIVLREQDFATITARYHAESPGTVYQANRFSGVFGYDKMWNRVLAPATRTEYVQGGVVWGNVVVDPSGLAESGGMYYPAELHLTEDYMSAVYAPGPYSLGGSVTANRQGLIYNWMPLLRVPAARQRWIDARTQLGMTLRCKRNGQVLVDARDWDTCDTGLIPGVYQLELGSTQTLRPTSTATHTVWSFNAVFPTANGEQRPQPIVDTRPEVPLSLTNTVTAGSQYPITVRTGYQEGTTGPGRFTVSAWISHDDGVTWTSLGTRNGHTVTFGATSPASARFATVRVRAVDSAGNAMDQTITRAWRVTT